MAVIHCWDIHRRNVSQAKIVSMMIVRSELVRRAPSIVSESYISWSTHTRSAYHVNLTLIELSIPADGRSYTVLFYAGKARPSGKRYVSQFDEDSELRLKLDPMSLDADCVLNARTIDELAIINRHAVGNELAPMTPGSGY